MAIYTYRDLIRVYAKGVRGGTNDADLLPKQRRLVEVMLNLASNAPFAGVIYPPTDGTRDEAVKHLGNIAWDARALVDAVLPVGKVDTFGVSMERAITILRNI
jgi:hypothetical protein